MKPFTSITAAAAVICTSIFTYAAPCYAELISTNCVFRDDVRNTQYVNKCRIKLDSQGFAESISWPVGDVGAGWRTARANEGGWHAYGSGSNPALENDDGRWIYPE